MRLCAKILALALLLLPRVSAASTIDITVFEPLGLEFGPWGANFSASHFDEILLDGVQRQGPAPYFDNFQGRVEFQADSLVSLTLSGDDDRTYSRYEYGPGTFTLTVHWTDEFGSSAEGTFEAPLLSLTVDLCEEELSAAGCSGSGESDGSGFATFGPGLFDPGLAHALRVGLAGQLSSFDFDLDLVTGDPSDNFRISGSPSGRETLEIDATVPEPSALSLVLLSAIAVLGSGRLRRQTR